jgi:hypothetical protein
MRRKLLFGLLFAGLCLLALVGLVLRPLASEPT